MKRILSALILVLASAGAGAQAPSPNAWSNEDYDFYAGDFNGDGYTDLLYVARNPSNPSGILLSDGTAPTIAWQSWASDYLGIPWSSNAYTVVVGDFNGDGKTDIFLQSNTPGDSYLLLTDSSGKITAINQTLPAQAMGLAWSADQHRLVVGDFNGDRHADLFFQPTAPGGLSAVVYSDANGLFTSSAPAQSWNDGYLGFNWSVPEATIYAGDFNGDGRSDLLIQAWPQNLGTANGITNYNYPPNLNGVVLAQPASGAQPFTMSGVQSWSRNAYGVDWSPLNFTLVIGDFNGDGLSDVLFQPLTAGGSLELLLGHSPGSIFLPAQGALPANVGISADVATLIPGNFAGGKTAGLLIQATSRTGSNSIAKNITSGIRAGRLALPTLTATSVQPAPAPSTTSSVSAPAAPLAGTVTPTSPGRTAGQFSVTPTGAATYNIPLWTPPGVRGIEPHLALHYTSGGPDGPMGPGWSLTGLSAIVRCGKTWASSGGAPAGVMLTTSDDICLDGNRLRKTSGNQLAAGSTYQTEIADFSNVTAYAMQGNGPQYFIVQGKDSRYYEYGNTANSRIFSSGMTTPYAWALNKVRDRQNNSMVFTYSGGTAVTLTKIQYTVSQGGLNTALYEVDFNYVARTGGTTITKYVTGGTVTQSQQLDNVTVLSLQPSSTTVRKYQLGYAASPTTNRALLQTVQECGGSSGTDCIRPTTITYQSSGAGWSTNPTSTGVSGQYGLIPVDLNGDGKLDLLYATQSGTTNTWYAVLATSTGYGSPIPTGISILNTQALITANFLGTGNGSQIVARVGTNWVLYRLNGSAFASQTIGPLDAFVNMAVDWDGDGLPDLVSNAGTRVSVYRNTSTGNGTVSVATTPYTVYNDTNLKNSWSCQGCTWPGGLTADFNGDGRGDVVAFEHHDSNTQGGGYDFLAVLTSNGFSAPASVTIINLQAAEGQPSILDMNGDGCSDIGTQLNVNLSHCDGTFSTIATAAPLTSTPFMYVDWDGDGQTDFLYASSGTWYVQRSTGTGLASAVPVPGIAAPATEAFSAADLDTDGQPDLAYVDVNNAYRVSYYPHKGVNTPPDLAASITDGFGINFSPSYFPISQYYYTKYADATFPDTDFQGPMYVVYQFSASDGTGGTYTNDFWYYGAHLNLQGRGFEGFYAARQHDSRNGVYQLDYYRRDFPFIGSQFTQETIASDTTTYIAYTVNDGYTSMTPGGLFGATSCTLCYFPYFTTSTVYNYEPTGQKAGGSFAYVSYTSTAYTYDSYGNLTDTRATTTDTDSGAGTPPYPSPFNGQQWITEINNTITNDNSAANWCLGRPSTTKTTKTVPNQTAQPRTVGHTIDYPNCRANVETVEPNDMRLKVTTNFGFDACGNTNSVSVVGLDQNGVAMPTRTTQTSYGTRCQLPESVTNPLNQTTQTVYGYAVSPPRPASSTLAASTTDPNGISISWQYDNFGRKTQETRPDGTYTTYVPSDCVSSSCWGVSDLRFLNQTYLYNSAGTLLRQESKFYDGLDRLRYDEGRRVLGAWDNAIYNYDSQGRKISYTLPYSSSRNGYHNYAYDVANRLYKDDLYDSSGTHYRTISISYLGQTVKVFDPNLHTITKVTDVAGKIRQVTDDSSNAVAGTTKYTFDPFGNLITILDADNIPSSYTYNIRGFKTGSNDADTGSWTFTPDSLNELVQQKDANGQVNGQVTTFGYDLLGRMTSRTEPESTTKTQWVYGTSASAHEIGQLNSVSKPDGYAEAYVYDGVGRPQTVTYTEDGTNYAFDYAYNNMGTVDTLTYPVSTSGVRFALKSVYDAYGYLNQLKDNAAGTVFWTLNTVNDANLPMLETLGNGAQVSTTYTPWTNEMLTRTEGSGGSTTNLQNLSYNWDPAGNLQKRVDNRQGLTEQFAYDSMNRLLSSTLNGTNNLILTYDASGNINSKNDVSSSPYVYDSVHKHAVKTAGSWSMTYDNNGNMITRGVGGTISYYSYNLPNVINYSGNSTQFFYNASHQRWKQIANYAGTAETTHYIGGMLEVMTRGSGATEYRHQIPAGSGTAVYTRRTDGSTGTYYATSDHLGSSDLVMDSAANVLTRESFTPFGARRGSAWTGVPSSADYTAFGNTTRKGFTGHEMLDSVALVHMNGRVYDPYLGRFLSADTVIQNLAATESINPYAYAWNDPLKYVDPSGHSLLGDILGLVAALVIMWVDPFDGFEFLYEWAYQALTAAVAGFVGGFVGALVSTGSLSAALTAGLIAGLTAAAFSGVGSFAQDAADTGSAWSKPDFVLAHAAVGCGSAMLSGGNCGRGALAAAISEAAVQGNWIKPAAIGKWGSFKGAAEAGLLGGATSEITGGNFSDGFSVAAAGYLYNCSVHVPKPTTVSFGYVPVAEGYHLFIKLEGGYDEEYFIRAGPAADGSALSGLASDISATAPVSGNGGFGNITVSYGDDARAADLARAVHWQALGTVNMSFSDAVTQLVVFGASVDAANIPYLPVSQNSNSFGAQAVTVLGLPRPTPTWPAYGSSTVLKVPGYN